VAAAFGIPARTLQRRLARAGADFTHLIEAVRPEVAVRLLGNSETTGVAPRDFKRRRLAP
jgi:hypothetical protein